MSRYWDDYLVHGGPGSGRYPKGSGERPRAIRGIGVFKRRSAKKQAVANAKKAAEDEKKRQKDEIGKMDSVTLSSHVKKAKQSGDINQIKMYQEHMTNHELRDALDRIDLNARVANLGEVKKGKEISDKLRKTADYSKSVADIMQNSVRAYNSYRVVRQMMQNKKPAGNGGIEKQLNNNKPKNINIKVSS